MKRKFLMFAFVADRKGSISALCVCLLPLIVLALLLFSDICLVSIAKSRLKTAVCAGCRAAASQYRVTGTISRSTVKRICVKNCPDIEHLEVKLYKPAGYDGTEHYYTEVTASVRIHTSILRDHEQKTVSVRSICRKKLR